MSSDRPEVAFGRRPAAIREDSAWLEPFEWYHEMREDAPVRYDSERGVWDVFRYDDVRRVLRDYEAFSSAFGDGDAIEHTPEERPPPTTHRTRPGVRIGRTMLSTDPPTHERLRSVVDEHFRAAAIRSYRPRVEDIVERRLAALGSGHVDFVESFSYPFPVDVIAALLGVPEDDRATFKRWSDAIVERPAETDRAGEERQERTQRAVDEMRAYFRERLAERREAPQDDLMSVIVAAGDGDPGLSEEEMLAFCILLLVAGNVTTTNLLTNAVWCFHEQDVLDDVREGSPPLEPALEEVLRLRSPVQALIRVARRDVELRGETVEADDVVVAWIGSANRDERQFTAPDRFDPTRRPNAHLAFGYGIHYCLGAPLARLEASVGLRALLDRFGRIDVDTSDLTPSPSALYGLERLPVTLA